MAEAPPVDQSLISESRNDLIRSIFRAYLNHDTGNRQLRLIAIGESGQGKSSLVNGLLGEEVAAEGHTLDPETKKVTKYTCRDGIALVWDTPGFGIDAEAIEKENVEAMARECAGQVDLMLYCISMESRRWPMHSDITTIRMMTEAFGPEIWRYCQFVLTFANEFRPRGYKDEDPDELFSRKVWEFEENVRKVLKEHAHLNEEDIQKIDVVAVGDPRPRQKNKSWKLPGTEDWFIDLWLAVSKRIQQSALSTLLQLNRHRIDIDEDSVRNPSEETHSRNVPYHAVYLDEHTEVPDISLDSSSEPTPLPSLADPAGEQATNDTPHRRSIPLYRIVYEQLKHEESAFTCYVKFYWEQQGQKDKIKVFGHMKGLMLGIGLWLKCKRAAGINWQEEQDNDNASTI